MTPPLASIITPCLNAGDRLVGCLESVAAQTYPAIEHIIVDGGSTDESCELASASGARLLSEPDGGQTEALNKGFALATGRYLAWLNADDRFMPDAVARTVETFLANPSVGWTYADCEVQRDNEVQEIIRPPRHLSRRSFNFGNRLAQPGTFLTRWALDRVGPLDEGLHLVMDFDLWLRLVDQDIPSAYISATLAMFEIHESSKTGSLALSEFFREEAIALLNNGRPHYAAIGFGRAAAAAALSDGRVEPGRLIAEVERLRAEAEQRGLHGEDGVVRSAAFAEAARLELQVSASGLRHLARRDPWRFASSRRMIGAAASRKSSRALRRLI